MNKKKYLNDLIAKHKKRLYLDLWDIDLRILKGKDCEYCESDESTNACLTPNPNYYDAVLCVHGRFWGYSEKQQEMIILHELCHLLTCKMNRLVSRLRNGELITENQVRDEWESTTEHLTKILS